MNDKIKAAIDEAIDDEFGYCRSKDGSYYSPEIYADYRDEFDNKTITKILESNYPKEAFDEELDEAYFYARCDYENDCIDAIRIRVRKDPALEELLLEEDEDEIREYILDKVCFELPENHFLDQEVYANIFVDTGDGNYDFVLNSVYPHYNGIKGERIDPKASIVWLAKQQGYTKTQLQQAMKNGIDKREPKGFLESMYVELINMGSHMTMLSFLARMTVGQLIELNDLMKHQDADGHKYDKSENPDCGYIVIDKKAETGLYDAWSGGGSVFEIQLEKDVKLPIKFIRSALPDGGDGYSIDEVYGMCGSCWRDVVKEIRGPRKKKVVNF